MSLSTRVRLLTARKPGTLLGAVTVVLLLMPLVLSGYQVGLLAETLIFAVFATAFNLLYGYTGLLSFGHAMFVATAGYTVAKVFTVLSPAFDVLGGLAPLGMWLAGLVLGVAVAGVFAVGIGYLAVQLEEIYFALITLSFSMAIYALANQDVPGKLLEAVGIGNGKFTNQSDGLTFIPGDVSVLGFEFQLLNLVDPTVFYVLTVFVFAGAIYALWRIVNSPFGVTCKAIRENPQRASAVGIDIRYHQWMTFIISGLFSGLAGAMLIMLNGQVDPQAHAYWTASAEPVVMTVVGGPLSFVGPIVGAFTFEYLRELIRQIPLLEEHWELSFGLLLLVVVLFTENGVAGLLERVRAYFSDTEE